MNEFDISYDGYTPDINERAHQRTPYHPPTETDTYRPPQESDAYRPPKSYEPEEEEPQPARRSNDDKRSRDKAKKEEEKRIAAEVREAQARERKKKREQRIKELKRESAKSDRPMAIVRFFTDERTRIFLGLSLIIISVFVLIAFFSHFNHGGEDQSVTNNLKLSQIAENPKTVGNAAGGFGAWLSKILLCDTLGIGSIVIFPYLWIVALALLGMRKCSFWGTTFRCLLLAISTSIVLGFVTYDAASVVYWGGNHGHYVNKFLIDNTTWLGALAVSLILIAAVCCVYLNELKIAWNKWRAAYRRHKMQEELRRERRRELQRLEAEEEEEARRNENARNEDAEIQISNITEAHNNRTESDTSSRIFDLAINEDNDKVDREPITKTSAEEPKVPVSQPHNNVAETDTDFSVNHVHSAPTESLVIDTKRDKRLADEEDSILVIDPENLNKAPIEEGITLVDDNFSIVAPKIEEADSSITIDKQDQPLGLYDHKAELAHYVYPPVDLLEDRPSGPIIDMEEQQANKALIEKTLLDYKIPISKIEATVGPTVTLYEIVPAEGVRIQQIKRLEDDIALSLKALGIRIIAPIPGKGTVGIEVPNNDPQTVSMRSVINSKKFQECKMALPMAMGATISNDIFIADMAKMPHLLVAGATGMGKSVGLNAIIASFLYKKHPSELKLVLIDPKMVEFSLYSKLDRHFLAKLPNEEDAIITDMNKVIQTLNSLCIEMDDRYELLRNANVRSLEEYNKKFTERKLRTEDGHKYLPYIVVIVDEFADLIMTQGKEVEQPIARIAQKARAVGIHMILATQRPSTNVITGLIKANFPGRIAFRVIQMVDSRTILDTTGANQLIGRGDMLFSHNGNMERVQCAFISTEEVEALTEFIDNQAGYEHAYYLPEYVPEEAEGGAIAGASMERDALFNEAARFVVTRQMGSTSSLQRQFGIGYNRAGKLMDQMEAAGIVGPVNGAKPRAILMDIVTLESILGD